MWHAHCWLKIRFIHDKIGMVYYNTIHYTLIDVLLILHMGRLTTNHSWYCISFTTVAQPLAHPGSHHSLPGSLHVGLFASGWCPIRSSPTAPRWNSCHQQSGCQIWRASNNLCVRCDAVDSGEFGALGFLGEVISGLPEMARNLEIVRMANCIGWSAFRIAAQIVELIIGIPSITLCLHTWANTKSCVPFIHLYTYSFL